MYIKEGRCMGLVNEASTIAILQYCWQWLIISSTSFEVTYKHHRVTKVRSCWVGICYQLRISGQNWLTDIHLIAKVAPILSEKSLWGLVAAVVRYIIYAYSHTCLWHTLDLEESCTHCTVIKIHRSRAFICVWLNSTTHRHAMIKNVYFGAAHYLLPAVNSTWTYL